ncbi:MAG: C-GCAxxG-C-C family protein, partial [Candidatus Neomarinimicrobiota bacterium]
MAVANNYKIQSDLIPKIATGFCGGMARTCGQCGALSGAIMSISLLTGRSEPADPKE